MIQTVSNTPTAELKNMNNIYVMNEGRPVSLAFSHKEIIAEISRREQLRISKINAEPALTEHVTMLDAYDAMLFIDVAHLTYEQSQSLDEQFKELCARLEISARQLVKNDQFTHLKLYEMHRTAQFLMLQLDTLRKEQSK